MLVENHLQSMTPLFAMTPENDGKYAETTLIAVSKMLMTLGGREAGELAAEARGDAYMAALEDLPCWAVQEAARKWYRGEYGPGHDYKWMPAPSTLRDLASLEYFRVKGVQRQLADLLSAEPLREFSAEHEAEMRERVKIPNLKWV